MDLTERPFSVGAAAEFSLVKLELGTDVEIVVALHGSKLNVRPFSGSSGEHLLHGAGDGDIHQGFLVHEMVLLLHRVELLEVGRNHREGRLRYVGEDDNLELKTLHVVESGEVHAPGVATALAK